MPSSIRALSIRKKGFPTSPGAIYTQRQTYHRFLLIDSCINTTYTLIPLCHLQIPSKAVLEDQERRRRELEAARESQRLTREAEERRHRQQLEAKRLEDEQREEQAQRERQRA